MTEVAASPSPLPAGSSGGPDNHAEGGRELAHGIVALVIC